MFSDSYKVSTKNLVFEEPTFDEEAHLSVNISSVPETEFSFETQGFQFSETFNKLGTSIKGAVETSTESEIKPPSPILDRSRQHCLPYSKQACLRPVKYTRHLQQIISADTAPPSNGLTFPGSIHSGESTMRPVRLCRGGVKAPIRSKPAIPQNVVGYVYPGPYQWNLQSASGLRTMGESSKKSRSRDLQVKAVINSRRVEGRDYKTSRRQFYVAADIDSNHSRQNIRYNTTGLYTLC